jgi:hypothetical protein
VQALGGIVAGTGLAVAASRADPARLIGWGALTLGLVSAVTWSGPVVSTELGLYLVLFGVAGVPGVIAAAGYQSMLQTVSEPRLTGRVVSTALAGMAVGNAVGMLLAGGLADVAGLAPLLGVQATLHMIAGVLALAGYRGRRAEPLRHQRPARHAPG